MATWAESSEIVTGLVLNKRLACNAVNPKSLFPPYDELITLYKKDGSIDTLIERVGLDPVQSAIHAEQSVNGTGNLADWLGILERSKRDYEASIMFEKFAHKLQAGEQIKWEEITSIAAKAQEGIGSGLVPMSEVTAMEVPFKLTGFKPIDEHFGGLPEIGQVLVAGTPGSAKTTLMLQIIASWIKTYPKENAAIFTLEMMAPELKMRMTEVFHLTDEEMSRIYIEDTPITPDETLSKAATIENLGIVGIDFADLLLSGETTESAMSYIYRTYMLGAKALHCPILLIAQLSGNYAGGIPRPQHIRWTRLAEALAWGIMMPYNPNTGWFEDNEDEDILPKVAGTAYIIGWKFRGGFRVHKEDSPGAIQLRFSGSDGWDFTRPGKWYPIKDGKPRIKKKY